MANKIAIVDPQDAHIRMSQLAVETLAAPQDANLRISQIVIEVIYLPQPSGSLRVSQAVIELIKSTLVQNPGGPEIYEA